MKKLKIILKSKQFVVFLIILTLLKIALYLKDDKDSIFNINDNDFTCTVLDINSQSYVLDCGEVIEAFIQSKDLNIGDVVRLEGNLEEYEENKNINLFNYKNYQKNKGIFYKLKVKNYQKISKTHNLIIKMKKNIVDRIKNLKSYSYLNAFVLGDKDRINENLIDAFKNIGIIHLFSVSGMHISLLIDLIDKIYYKNNKLKQVITIIFLIIYYELIESISLLRCLVFLVVKNIDLNLNLNIKKEVLILISVLIILISKPNSIFNIGFYYSVIISSGISICSSKIVKIKNKIIKMFIISLISFLLSLPLNIYSYYEVNILSIIYNMIFIPFVSLIFFPFALLTLIFPLFDDIFYLITNIFESIVLFVDNYYLILIFRKPTIFVMILYYLIIILSLYNYKFLYYLFLLILFHYNYNSIVRNDYLLMLDVGQGDSILLSIENNNILIDTGGIYNSNDISKYTTIPLIKSLGISKINYMIVSHGDYDHMGEAINLVENFKVEKVIFNCGEYNDLEKKLIEVLDKKKTPYYSCIKELNVDNNKLYFLNNKDYGNENDNSSVIYTKLNNHKFLFMGDAGVEVEQDLIEKYNLQDIDVLKVGHHGSNTSSSNNFIDEINPKYSIISVGKNNRYGHPNDGVLDNLEDSQIYRTDQDGSIMFKIKNNKLQIETCPP